MPRARVVWTPDFGCEVPDSIQPGNPEFQFPEPASKSPTGQPPTSLDSKEVDVGFKTLDQSQNSHIKGLSVSEVMRIENMITQVQLY